MFRLLFVFALSFAVSSQAIAAVKWGNSKSESNGAAKNISIPQYIFAQAVNQSCQWRANMSISVSEGFVRLYH